MISLMCGIQFLSILFIIFAAIFIREIVFFYCCCLYLVLVLGNTWFVERVQYISSVLSILWSSLRHMFGTCSSLALYCRGGEGGGPLTKISLQEEGVYFSFYVIVHF